MYEAELEGVMSAEDASGKGKFGDPASAHGVSDGAEDDIRPHANANLCESETGALGGDRDMSAGSQADPATECCALHCGDDRLERMEPEGENTLMNGGARGGIGRDHVFQTHIRAKD